ncbi:MAG TPA: thioredoxin fold domain-containing protein [Acidobacteriota bacterium]|nr:thioredoxin fold domain-containing protein [Acidobacteriota bacterium]
MKIASAFALITLLATFSCQASTWITDFDTALTESQKTSKPIFLDVFADWCAWCHKLDKEVYSDPKFTSYMSSYILARIDSEDGKQGSDVAAKYKIDSLPTMLVLDGSGNVLNRVSGYMNAAELIEELEHVRKLLDAEMKHPEKTDASFLLASSYLERQMYKEAEERYKKILNSASATSVQKEKAQFSIALAEYYQGKPQAALKALEQYYTTYQNGASDEDALLLSSQIHIELNSNEKALEYLRTFMKRHPKSGNAVRAKQVLSALEKECPSC